MDSRIISHLGEALISDEKIALLELIKNSSDADSLNCNIEIDTHFQSQHGFGRIILEDNGNGMNPFIIENAFLRIASSFKIRQQKISPIYKRLALGSKGIGRLSLNQLGSYVEVETKLNTEIFDYVTNLKEYFGTDDITALIKENENKYFKFSINWLDFNNSIKLEDIDIEIQEYDSTNKLFCKKTHGTKITVYGLKGISFWEHKNTKKELEKDVLSFINPFLSEKFNFKVKIDLNKEIFRNDLYDKKRLKNISDVTTSFWYFSTEKRLKIHVKRNPQYIKFLIDKLLERMDIAEFELVNSNIDYQHFYDEFCEDNIEFLLNRDSMNKKIPEAKINVLFVNEDNEFLLPGDFEGKFYGFNRDSKNTVPKTEIKNLLDNISGVKMYRNNFRVFPYGEKDWLELGKKSQMQINNIYRPSNTTGYVYIDGDENLEKLKELTNREGLILDEYGKNFLFIMRDIIAHLAAEFDNNLRKNLNIPKSKRNASNVDDVLDLKTIRFIKKEDPFKKTTNSVNSVKKHFEERLNNLKIKITTEDDKKEINKLSTLVEENFSVIKSNLNEIATVKDKRVVQFELEQENLRKFYPVIGATIVAETLSHEIIRLSNNIKYSSLQIRGLIGKEPLKIQNDSIINNLNIIDSNTKFLSRYASLLDVNSYSKRRRYENEDLKNHVQTIFSESPLLNYKDEIIALKISGEGFQRKIVKEGFSIIIENLIINSVYWLEKMNIKNPTIYIEFNSEKQSIKFWDNGYGIHPNISETLFEPFSTNKPHGEGRGMGLFIVKELLKEINGDITLLKDLNAFNNKFILEIDFVEE